MGVYLASLCEGGGICNSKCRREYFLQKFKRMKLPQSVLRTASSLKREPTLYINLSVRM